MNPARFALTELELSRHRMWSPLYRPRTFWSVVLVFVIATVIAGLEHIPFTEMTYFGAYSTAIVSFGLTASVVASVHGAEKMWSLGLPLSRRAILAAKLLAGSIVVARAIVLLWGSMAIGMAILVISSHGEVIIKASDASQAMFILVLTLCSSIMVIILGGFMPLFHYGWWRLGYAGVWLFAVGWFGPIIGSAASGHGLKLTVQAVLRDGGIMLAVAVVLAALLYRFAPAVMRAPARQTGANRQYGRPDKRTGQSSGTAKMSRAFEPKSMSPFRAVIRLEFSRYRPWRRDTTRVNHVLVAIALLLIAGIAGVAMGFGHELSGVVVGVFTIISAGGIIGYYIILLRSTQDGYNKWFVSYPVTPLRLIVARVTGYYLRFLTAAALVLVATGVGVLAAVLIHFTQYHWVSGLLVLWHAVLLSALFTAFMFTVLTGALAFFRKGVASVILMGFMYFAAFESCMMWFPRLYVHPGKMYWVIVAAIIVVGTPISVWSVRFAATHIDRLTQSVASKNSPWASWNRWGNPS